LKSPTAGTLIQKVKFGLRKAFLIVFKISAKTQKYVYATDGKTI
jgi:hypothetical protein